MGEVSSVVMIAAGLVGAAWFAHLFVQGEYEFCFPSLLCFSASMLEISWVFHPEVNLHRNIAWNVNEIGLILFMVLLSRRCKR